jgi:hypothetical protein
MEETKTTTYRGERFEVHRASADSATVQILCEIHEHGEYIIGLLEDALGWHVGRKETGGYVCGDSFSVAVEHCADRLLEECLVWRHREIPPANVNHWTQFSLMEAQAKLEVDTFFAQTT